MDQPLDVFGQQPGLNKLYTQLCLCFPIPPAGREDIVKSLRDGLHALANAVPWLLGKVVLSETTKQYRIEPGEDEIALVVKDLTYRMPSISDLRTAGYPAKYLDEEIIAPCNTIRKTPAEPASVFLVQANFVDGGVLLVICGLHSCMDMTGQGFITYLLANACRDQPFDAEELRAANSRGVEAIPLFDADEVNLQQETLRPQQSPAPQTPSHDSPAMWTYLVFSGTNLATLKSRASDTITTDFVSTDDCLCALLWQSITRARTQRFSSTDMETGFTRTVDTRNAAGVPVNYTGNAAVKTLSRMTVQHVLDSSLGSLASVLRKSLKGAGHRLRHDATLLSQGQFPDKVAIVPSTGINLSSWAKERVYDLDFGPSWGKPEAVRRPSFEAWESLIYLMPKREDGEIAVAVCLREEDLQRLNVDTAFTEYGRMLG